MAAIPTFSFSILAKNLTGGVFAQIKNSFAGIKFGGQQIGETMGGAVAQTGGLIGELIKANLAIKAMDWAWAKVNTAVGKVKGSFAEATHLQNSLIIASTTFSALTGSSYDEAAAAMERLRNRLAASAATLPGSTQDYKRLATTINDNLIEAFKDPDGKLDVQAWEDSVASISESFGAITAASTKDTGNTALALTKALGGAGVASLRQLSLFEQNPVLLNELEKKLGERNAKTLQDLDLKDRVSIIQEIGEKFISEDFKSAAGESVDGLMQSFKSTLFDPSSGIFGVMRDLEKNTEGTQSVFAAYNETVKMFIGAESLWSNFNKIFQKLGVVVDPMKILKSGFDFFNNALRVVVNILSGINRILAPAQEGAIALKGGIADIAKIPQTVADNLKALDLRRVLDLITSSIGRFIEPWVSKNLGVVADAVAGEGGHGYRIDYQGYFKKIAGVLFTKTGDWLIQFGDRLGSAVVSVLDIAAKVFYTTADLVISKAPKIGEFVGNIAGSVVVTLGNLMSGFSTWIADQLPRFLSTVRSGILAIGEFIKKLDFADIVIKFVRSIMPGVNAGLQSLVSTGIPGIVNVFSSAVSVATDVVGEISKAIVLGLGTFVVGIDWGRLVLAVGKGLLNLNWGQVIVAVGKSYVTLLALGLVKSAAVGVLGITNAFVGNFIAGFSSAVLGGLAGAFAPLTALIGNTIAGLSSAILGGLTGAFAPVTGLLVKFSAAWTSAILGGLAPILASTSAFFAGLSSAIMGGFAGAIASIGLVLAPLAIVAASVAVAVGLLAGAFLLLSGGDVENFRYAAEGWKAEMQQLTGVEINGIGDAFAASILGFWDGSKAIAGMVGSYFTLAKSEIHLSLQRTMRAIASFGNAVSSLPGRAANAARATGGAISKLPGKAALAAHTVTQDVGAGLSQTKSDLEGVSGVEINSIGSAVGVVVFQYVKLLPEMVGGIFGAIGSGLRLVVSQVRLSVAQFLNGPAWKNWVLGWQTLGVLISGLPGAIVEFFKQRWSDWLLGWQTLGLIISEIPGTIVGAIKSWWGDWLNGWQVLGDYAVSAAQSIYSTAVSWFERIKSGLATAWQFILGIPDALLEIAKSARSTIVSAAKSVADSVLSGISAIAQWWKGLWGKVWGTLEPFAKIIGNDANNLKQTWSIISDALRGIPDAIKELIDKVKEAVKGFIPNTIAGVGNAVAAAAAPVTEPVKEAASSISSTAGKILDGATTIIQNVISGGKEEKEKKEEAPTPITIPSMFSGHIPNFAGGNAGLVPALLKAVNLERANMPSGAEVAIANTSEFILKPTQMSGLVAAIAGKFSPSRRSVGKESGFNLGGIVEAISGLMGGQKGPANIIQSAGPLLSQVSPNLGGIVEAISGLMGGQKGFGDVAKSVSPLVSKISPGLEDFIGNIAGLFGGQPSIPAGEPITPTFPVPQPFSLPSPVSIPPGVVPVGEPIPTPSHQSLSQDSQATNKTINLGPITINISGIQGTDPESHAREILRYFDLFLQEEMGATL